MSSTTSTIVTLNRVRQSDHPRVGGKAATLGTLLDAGFPIPAGLCVTTAAFHLALVPFQQTVNRRMAGADLLDPLTAQQVADQIAALLLDLTLPSLVVQELQFTLAQLPDMSLSDPGFPARAPWFAVRSSATVEDSAEASYAGQYATILGVQGEAAIHAAMLTCWRSFFSANALVARAQHHGLSAHEGMAVLIQPMINAECAGVCFSVDPVAQRRDRVVINAGWGLGIGIVDGKVPTDTIWVHREDSELEQQWIEPKPEEITLDGSSHPALAPVSIERQRAACLPSEWRERVAQFGIAAEHLLGTPQDVEWAIADGQIWVLQSRPITALPPEVAQPRPFPITWENEADRHSFWQRHTNEGWPDVQMPLELDHLAALESVWEEASRAMGVEHNRQLIHCNGRAYDRPIPIEWSVAERTIRRAAMLDLWERLQREGRTAWDHWGPEIIKATERLRDFDHGSADGPALATHVEEALAVFRRHWALHPYMTFNPPDSFFDAFAAISGLSGDENGSTNRESNSKGGQQATVKEAAYRLLDGGETPLTRLIDSLYALACIARQESSTAVLIAERPDDLMAQLSAQPKSAPFLAALEALMAIYGERNGHGYGSSSTLRQPTWREQPEEVIALLSPYMDPNLESPAVARARVKQAINAQVDTLCNGCPDEALVATFRNELAYARKRFALLEVHNHYMDQMFYGQLRHAVMAAARWLVAQTVLETTDDVLWLRFDEIAKGLRADAPEPFGELIAARRVDHAKWCALEAPPFLGVPNAQLSERPPFHDEVTNDEVTNSKTSAANALPPHNLQGQGASPGHYRGQVRVMRDVHTLPKLAPGDILVAWNIGPRWTPIFPMLGGLILESGSVGQHAAATAREYGVPAVVNVKQAIAHIPDGAWVTIDGVAGTIALEASATA